MVRANLVRVYMMVGLLFPIFTSQNVTKNLVVTISAGTGAAEEFVLPSGRTRNIVYPGEQIRAVIRLYNDSDEEVRLSLRPAKMTQLITIQWAEAPNKQSESRPALQPGKMYKGEDIKPSAEIERLDKLGPQETMTTEWTLAAKDTSALVPGDYEIKVSYVVPPEIEQQLQRLGQRIAVHGASYRFEVREPTTLEDRLEILHRAAVRAYLSKNYDQAVSKVNELLAVYPNSSAGYTLLGYIYFDQGDYAQAIKADEKALELLESGADVIRLRGKAGGDNRDHFTGFLKVRIQAAKERLQRR
jgi:tetratricopeptide (TPR) repeat protein